MVNRATKRLMAKQQRAEQRSGGGSAGAGGGGGDGRAGRGAGDDERPDRGRPARLERKKRTPPRQFLKEVRVELKKVAWPSKREVATYTFVVLVSVLFVTAVVFALDFGMNELVFTVFKKDAQ